jgi:hypothetical protein
MQSQSSVPELDEQLSAFFDNELDEGVRALIEGKLDGDPEIAARIADLAFMRTMVVGDLEHQAERVPEARFEQIWDSFGDALERESRLQEAAEAPPAFWQRLLAWARPVRYPLAAAATVGALALVIARSVGAPSEGTEPKLAENTQAEQASDAAEPEAEVERAPVGPKFMPAPEPKPRLAVAPEPHPQPDVEVFPQPEPGEAEIRRIEFGGQMGTISQVEGSRGATTVIWVTEEADPVDSERSL